LTSKVLSEIVEKSAGPTNARWVFPALDRYLF
jgi:hypothetical protein